MNSGPEYEVLGGTPDPDQMTREEYSKVYPEYDEDDLDVIFAFREDD